MDVTHITDANAFESFLIMGDTDVAHVRSDLEINPALDLFDVPDTDISYNGYRMVIHNPATTGITPMEFLVSPSEDYIDLNRSYFQMKLRLKYTDDSNISTSSDHVVNNMAHSIIKYVSVRLNGTLTSPQTDTYPYKAYFETLLNTNRDEGETIMAPQDWHNVFDLPAQLVSGNGADTLSTTGHSDQQKANRILLQRVTGEYASREKCLMFRPHLEVFHTNEVLVPQTEVKIKFFFNDPDFLTYGRTQLATPANNKHVRLNPEDIEIRFIVCQLRLNSNMYKTLSLSRAETPFAEYPVVRGEIRTYTFQGTSDSWEGNIFQNRIPDRTIVGLLDAKAFNGDKSYYPYAFQKFGLETIKQIVRGEEYPYETLELNGTDDTRDPLGFFRFFLASGARKKNQPTMLKYSDWGQNKNCTSFMFDNVASGDAESDKLNPRQSGDLQIKIKFNAAPNKVITVMIYGEFENLLELDKFGGVLYNIYERN